MFIVNVKVVQFDSIGVVCILLSFWYKYMKSSMSIKFLLTIE